MNLKNLGEGMQVVYLQENQLSDYSFDILMLERTLAMFSGFNEEIGEKYRFLPFYSRDVEKLQHDLSNNF